MADSSTNQQVVSSISPPPGGGANVLYVGDEKEFAGHKVLIKRLLVKNRQFIPRNDIPLESGEEVVLEGRGLDLYDRIGFTLTDGGSSFDVVLKSSASGDSLFSFKMPNIAGQVKDGGRFWLKLLSRTFPPINATLEPHAVYFLEQPEDKKDTKTAGEEREGRAAAARGSQGEPTDLVMGAMGDVLGGIAGALKSTTGASSVGTKTISQSGTATSPAAGKSASVETSGGGDNQTEVYEEQTASQPITSTSEVSTGGQTIRESGTVSTGGQVRTEGSTGATRTISTGGTVQTAGSAGARTEVSSTVSGGGGVAGGGSSQTTATGQTSVGGNVSGTADISSKVVSGGQTNATQTVTGQSSTPASGSAGAGGGATETVKQNVNLSEKTETKTEAGVKANQAAENKGQAQTQTPGTASAPTAPTSSQDSTLPLTAGTAGEGAGSPAFGSQTPVMPSMPSQPAGLNISAGGTAAPSPAGKPVAQGGTNASAPLDDKNKEANAKAGAPPKESDQTEPKESPISPKGKQDQDKGLPMREPGDAKEPDKEAKPPSEAPPGPAKRPKPEDGVKPKVPPPLGQAGGLHGQKPAGSGSPQAGQPGRQPPAGQENKPIDGANGKPGKGLQSPVKSPSEGGGSAPGTEQPKGESAQPGAPAGPPSAQNRSPRNVFQDPRKPKEENPFAEKNNPAAYPTVRRLLDKKSELAGKGIGQASSKIWYYGFGSSCATFFTGLDFMLGAVVMDAYWIFGYRKDPNLFPLKGWQKAVTIAANVVPPILITLILALIMVAGCNWPTPIRTSAGNKYTLTVIGAFIGDDCKYFDVSNITSSGTNATSNTPAASTQTTSQTTGTPITPR